MWRKSLSFDNGEFSTVFPDYLSDFVSVIGYNGFPNDVDQVKRHLNLIFDIFMTIITRGNV